MIVGIDLGTTNSLVAVFRHGAPELIPNALGHFLTPSAVSVADDGTMLVGLAARERLASHPGSTVTAFKRAMGSERTFNLGQRKLRAEELSALVIGALKADAQAYLGQEVTEAVITVPAYFNEAQRRATKIAGELAGLKVERLLSEPTAAGLAYGLQERPDQTTFLVFDLGGGTFDVSVLEYFEGVVEVHASAGDTRLGGEDFVEVLLAWFASTVQGLSEADKHAILNDKAMWRVAEQAKRELSSAETATMHYLRHGATLTLEVTRVEFERRCEPLLQRLRKPIERALLDARLDPGTLSEVVMVGGASRMPMVRQMLTRLFGRLPLRTINPDETIAHGAAIQAGLKARDAALKEVVLTDVMPFSLGIVSSEEINRNWFHDRFSPIIERNSAVPVSRVQTYGTTVDGQSKIAIDVRQGESPVGSENLKLGSLLIEVPAGARGAETVNVRFTYDVNGLLEVDVLVPSSGSVFRTVIQRNSEEMSEEQVAAALEKLRAIKLHPRDKQENIYLIERAKRLYADLLGPQRQAINQALMQFELALDSQDERHIAVHVRHFKQFMDAIDTSFIL